MKTDIDDILLQARFAKLATAIGKEMRNRNQSPLLYFHQYLRGDSVLAQQCASLENDVVNELDGYQLDHIRTNLSWLVFHAKDEDGSIDRDKLAQNLCVQIIEDLMPKFDDEINGIDDFELVNSIGLSVSKHGLVSLNNSRMRLLHHAIELDGDRLVYLHPFMRRYYSANFVDLPAYLRNELLAGNQVSVRLDPSRYGLRKYYQDLIEADYWHGPKLSESILYDTKLAGRTVHGSRGPMNLSYDVRYTVFRTKMMDENLREFTIEEYCPVEQTFGRDGYSPGFTVKQCIQKFGHFVFDQKHKVFNHADGAVRVMSTDEYRDLYQDIAAGKDVGEKAGKRKKLFLVEGAIPLDRIGELMAEWFRYNSLVIEYFTGEDIEPYITYEKLEAALSE